MSQPLVSQLLLDDPDLADVVAEFVGELPGRISELRTAFDTLDWELLRTLAHRLKGAGGSYGYPDVSRLAATMEDAFREHRSDSFGEWINELQQLASAAQAGLPPI